MIQNKITGKEAENAVIRKMTQEGYHFIARNFAVHNMGELDVVMSKDDEIYVVEVKSRLADTFYTDPAASIGYAKRIRMINTTKVLIRKYNLYDKNIIFLAGCVTRRRDGTIDKVEIIPF